MSGGGDRHRVTVRIDSRFEDIDLVDRVAAAWLTFAGLPADDRDHLVLGVREAVANAVLHGNRRDAVRAVEIVFARRNNMAIIRVQDEGDGFDVEALPDPLAPENLLRPSGRGILLMRAYADEVDFSFDDGTRVELRKALPAPGSGDQ